ncbi:hypothetical protein ACM55F_06420 [Flavobacterium sp. XS2P12]|uniref:hypothetical protein n=1 Tax=Flavobacterium melibiosi TaxID=3398734 RepID=UPI003A85C4A3
MKRLIWILAFILIGCSSKENEVKNIEFMAYSWNVETPINKVQPKFKTQCEIYPQLALVCPHSLVLVCNEYLLKLKDKL